MKRIKKRKTKSKTKKYPKIELNIVFSQHYNKKGLKKFKELFKDSDVIFFESRGWENSNLSFYQDVSRGKIKKEEIGEYIKEGKSNRECLFREYTIKKSEIIHNSQKPIFLTDIKYRSKEWNEYLKLRKSILKLSEDSEKKYFNGKFNEAIELSKKLFNFEVKRNNLIEKTIVREIFEAIDKVKKDKSFKNKKKIKILGNFGKAHFDIVKQLKKKIKKEDNIRINKISGLPNGIKLSIKALTLGSEIIIKKSNNIPIKKSDYIRAILEELFLYECGKSNPLINNKADELCLAIRRIVEKLSFNDLRKISNLKILTDEGAKKMKDFLKEKGLFIPTTQKELKQILGKDYHKFD